jgi:hypothetical protein
MCSSGDKTAKASEVAQANFTNTLQANYSKQFAAQTAVLAHLTKTLDPMIDHQTGYSPEALAAMRTSATEGVTTAYDNAEQATQNRQFALGGRDLPSGVSAMELGSLEGGKASNIAGAQRQITLQNEQQKNANFWNAINAEQGNSAQMNPTNAADAANSGSNSVANLSGAYQASKQSQLMGVLGAAIGGAATLGSAKITKCWIAAELYGGWDKPEVHAIRSWLSFQAETRWFWSLFVSLYLVFGRAGAWTVRHSRAARWVARKIFDSILKAAYATDLS